MLRGLLSPRDFAVFIATCFVVFFRRMTSRSSLPRASWSPLPRDFAVFVAACFTVFSAASLGGLHAASGSTLAPRSSSPLHPPGKTRQSRSGLSLGQRRAHNQQNRVRLIERRGARLHSISDRDQSLTRIILMRLEGCGTTRPPHVSRRTGLP